MDGCRGQLDIRFFESCFSRERVHLTIREKLLAVEPAEDFDQFSDHARPAGLVTCPDSGAVVSMKVLVKEDTIPPIRIPLEFVGASVDWSLALFIPKEDLRQTVSDFARHVKKVHPITRTRRTFDLEAVAGIEVKGQQGANQQDVDGHPNGAPPV